MTSRDADDVTQSWWRHVSKLTLIRVECIRWFSWLTLSCKLLLLRRSSSRLCKRRDHSVTRELRRRRRRISNSYITLILVTPGPCKTVTWPKMPELGRFDGYNLTRYCCTGLFKKYQVFARVLFGIWRSEICWFNVSVRIQDTQIFMVLSNTNLMNAYFNI